MPMPKMTGRRSSGSSGAPANIQQRRQSSMAGRAAATGDAEFLASQGETGFLGLIHNKRSLSLALFASLGGVLYGYVR